jgi:hypothetical protein
MRVGLLSDRTRDVYDSGVVTELYMQDGVRVSTESGWDIWTWSHAIVEL